MFRPTKAPEFEKWCEEMKNQISPESWKGMDKEVKDYIAITVPLVKKKIETLEVIFEMYRTKYREDDFIGDGFGAKVGNTTYMGL